MLNELASEYGLHPMGKGFLTGKINIGAGIHPYRMRPCSSRRIVIQ
jgi:hypothetical protein